MRLGGANKKDVEYILSGVEIYPDHRCRAWSEAELVYNGSTLDSISLEVPRNLKYTLGVTVVPVISK